MRGEAGHGTQLIPPFYAGLRRLYGCHLDKCQGWSEDSPVYHRFQRTAPITVSYPACEPPNLLTLWQSCY